MTYETHNVEIESVTEMAAIIPRVGQKLDSQKQRDSQQSMYTRLLASEESIKGSENIPRKVSEKYETPMILSVDRNTPLKTPVELSVKNSSPQRESDKTKNVYIRKNVLEKDPFVQY